MKKKLLNIILCLLLIFYISESVFACQNVKDRLIDNMNKFAKCTKGANYGGTDGFIIEGIVNGKCHYKKVKIDIQKTKVLANCYAPMFFMREFADDNIHMANEMCNGDKMASGGYTPKMNENTLNIFCK